MSEMNPQIIGWLVIAVAFVFAMSFALGMQYATDRILRHLRGKPRE